MKRYLIVLVGAVLVTGPREGEARSPGDDRVEIEERFVRVAGADFRALCTGARPEVVLLHGAGGSADDWRAVLRLLDGRVSACAYDRRGSGGSDPAPEHRGWYEVMDELRRVHRALGAPPRYVLVGQGLGGLYARLFAAGRPVDLGGLLLLDPTHEDMPERARPGIPEEAWREWLRERQRPNDDGLVETRLADRARQAHLPPIPVTVVTATRRRDGDGWDSRFLDEAARQVHASILQGVRSGRHVPARGSGPAVHVDAPELVADEIVRLVEARGAG